MIKEAIEKILELQRPPTYMVGGRNYFTSNNTPVYEPEAPSLKVHTLTGLVDWIKQAEAAENGGIQFIHIANHAQVNVCSADFGSFKQRPVFLAAALFENQDGFRFGYFYDTESFIIRLQSQFVQTHVTAAILALVGNIKDEKVKQIQDDGVTQTVTAKAGIARIENVQVPNPVVLKPYRTFLEVDQPNLLCVLRLRSGKEGGTPRMRSLRGGRRAVALHGHRKHS